jgi:hypothetical protein
MVDETERVRRRRIGMWLFALVWLSCAWFGSWAMNPNNSTRLFAAVSLAEQGDATIDEFAALTIDKAAFGDHIYLDKAPGTTLMALPWVAAAGALTGRHARDIPLGLYDPQTEDFFRLRMALATAFGAALLTALAAVLLFDLGSRATGSIGAGLFGALAFALGTPVWGWSTTLFGHAPVAALLVVAAWAIWRGTQPGAPPVRHAVLACAALGWAVVIEYSAVLEAAPIALWALWRMRDWGARRWPVVAAASAAGVVALLPLIGYNLLAFGTVFRLGYQGVVGFDGMQQGFFGLTYPKPHVLYEILVGPRRGIVWVAPVLLLAPFGLARLIRRPETRDLGVLAAAVAATAFLYNASYIYWDGGHSTGPRHAVPAIGFLALGLAGLWRDAEDDLDRWLAAGLLAVSVALNLAIASAEITAPDNFAFPIWDRVGALFGSGQLRTVPSLFWGWTPWQGLTLYLVLASALSAMLYQAWRKG